MKAASDCSACARVTGQAKLSSRPGVIGEARLHQRQHLVRDARRARSSARGGTAPGPAAPNASRLSASKFHWPPQGLPQRSISTPCVCACSR